MTDYGGVSAAVYGDAEKADILRQLDRLLDNPHFSHSKRFPSFLRYIIQEELEGRGDQLKERTLGIEVFGRHAGYDTTTDPIVRVTAAEIRKRIAQYYQDSDSPDELRISLPPGSYIPHFEWPHAASALSPATPASLNEFSSAPNAPESIPQPLAAHARARSRAWWLALAAVLLISAATAFWLSTRPSTLD